MPTMTRVPMHFWPVAVLGVLWNSFGAYDYLMSKTVGEPYYRDMGMTDAQIAYMADYPLWMTIDWAIGVWFGLLGAVLMLARRKLAAPVLLISLAAFLISLVSTYVLSDGAQAMGDGGWMQLVVLAGCVFLAWYSRRQAGLGVLR